MPVFCECQLTPVMAETTGEAAAATISKVHKAGELSKFVDTVILSVPLMRNISAMHFAGVQTFIPQQHFASVFRPPAC